jgi:general secretion pathway protein D
MVPGTTLTEMIDVLAKRLGINYILDPTVRGTVTIYTYGEVKPVDLMPLLETILRVNGATMVKVGDFYRIVPIARASQLPIEPTVNPDPKTLPDDERMMLNLIFLKYATAGEMDALLAPFLGEGASHKAYEPANLLIIQDNSRSMRRTMELISLFDSETFAGQRVRIFEIENSVPSDLVKELDSVFKAYALSDKSAPVRFIPIDRINVLIAVAPNPGIFVEVENWIKKLDLPVRITAGGVNNYVYRLKYGRAETVAAAILALYTGDTSALASLAYAANASMVSAGLGVGGPGGLGANYGIGGLGANYGMGGAGAYGQYGSPYGAYGGLGAYPGGYRNQAVPFAPLNPLTPAANPAPRSPGAGGTPVPVGQDQTGTYLAPPSGAQGAFGAIPGIIANPFDNTLLIRATPQDYEQLLKLLRQLDIAPRQVLIDAKIYEVTLTDALSGGVQTYLQQVGTKAATSTVGDLPGAPSPSRTLAAVGSAGGIGLTTGALVLKAHELLIALAASDLKTHARIVSAPSVIATDSIPATMNVGSQVPTLTSVAATGVQSGGSSVFANTISNTSTGTTLSILARVNSSGIVTMVINQQVSAPVAPLPSAAIQSPSFSNRSVSTQMTVEDGDTVAIGGIITESHTESSGGVPFLHRIPVVGAAFGAKSVTSDRSELIIFLTPHVIYDTSQVTDATEELKGRLKRAAKLLQE